MFYLDVADCQVQRSKLGHQGFYNMLIFRIAALTPIIAAHFGWNKIHAKNADKKRQAKVKKRSKPKLKPDFEDI